MALPFPIPSEAGIQDPKTREILAAVRANLEVLGGKSSAAVPTKKELAKAGIIKNIKPDGSFTKG